MENMEENISSEDKTLSMLCHLSMTIGGILLPIIVWAIKKEQSKFVRYHALQSIFFQLAISVVIAVAIVVFAVLIILIGAGISTARHLDSTSGISVVMIILSFVFFGVITVAAVGGVGYSIYLAIKSYQGEKTKIPVIGKIIYEKVYGNK